MSLSVLFKARDLTDVSGVIALPGPLRFTVKNYTHRAIGGPSQASIAVSGPALALGGILGLLRCPVEIRDDRTGKVVWWGYVESAEAWIGGVKLRASMDGVYNRVKVQYRLSHGATSGQQAETAWASNAASVTDYGQKETILGVNQTTAAAAENYRATYLDAHKRPRPAPIEIGTGNGGRLTCRGWWATLGWRHMDMESLAVASFVTTTGDAMQQPLSSGCRVLQSFTVATTKTVRILGFFMRRGAGSNPYNPTTVVARLHSGALGSLTQLKLSASVSETDIGEDFHWHWFILSADQSVVAATTYWVDMGRDPAASWGVFWEVRVDEAVGDTGGTMAIHNHGRQDTRPNSVRASGGGVVADADMPFMALSLPDSTTIISDIATAVGEFIAGTDIEDTSGLSLSEYREPDANALDDIEELLSMGTTNSRRLLADVQADRRLRVREEEAADTAEAVTADYQLISEYDPHGKALPAILDNLGNPVEFSRCPVGMWLRYSGPLMKGLVEAGDDKAFIEEATYDAGSGALRLRARGDVDVWDFTITKSLGYGDE